MNTRKKLLINVTIVFLLCFFIPLSLFSVEGEPNSVHVFIAGILCILGLIFGILQMLFFHKRRYDHQIHSDSSDLRINKFLISCFCWFFLLFFFIGGITMVLHFW